MNASRTAACASVLAVVISLVVPAGSDGKWCWEPPIQTTHAEAFDADPDSAGALGGYLALGRVGPWHLHRVYSPWRNGRIWVNGLDQYCGVDADLDWAQAWVDREDLSGGEIAGTDITYATDGTLFVDASDRVHTVHEMWRQNSVVIHAGYRRRGHPTWTGDPVVVASCAGSPKMWFEEATGRLHAVYRTGDGTDLCGKKVHDGWLTHNWAVLDEAVDPAAWSHETYVTDVFNHGIPIVDANGVVHVLATVDDSVGGLRRLRLLHAYGTPPPNPGAEWSNVATDTVDESFSPPGAEEGEEGVSAVLAPGELRQGDEIWVAFHRWEDSGVKEAYVLKIDVSAPTPLYSALRRVSEGDGIRSVDPQLFRASDGGLHLIYTEPTAFPPLSYDPSAPPLSHLYHRVNRGDPLHAEDWTPRSRITWARRTTAQWPGFVADEDTVWTVYACHDDDGPSPDLNWEGWFQRGYDLGTDNAAVFGERVTWSGTVNLAADFLVCPAGTLEVAPGTVVTFEADTDTLNLGRDTSRAEIVVRGVLLVDGEPANPVVFHSGGQAGDWGGIYFAPGADGTQSRMEYTEIRDAWAGVWCDAVAPSLGHLAFGGNEIADILLPGDTRIAPGTEWNLDAPTRVVTFDYPASEDTLGTAGFTDLIVLGSLVTQSGAPQDSVWFESVAKDEVNGDDWGGIIVAAGGTAILRGCSVGYALRGVYFADAATAVLENSRVHHYAQEGVFDYGSDALIQRCRVERGANFDPQVETTGIHTKSSVCELRENTIGAQPIYGIWLQFGKLSCKGLPWGPVDTLRVIGNALAGTNGLVDPSASAAIRGEYLCLNSATVIDHNTVFAWSGRALDLRETSDVHVVCNTFHGNYAGAQFHGRWWLQSFEEDVFWTGNSLRQNFSENLRILYEVGLQLHDPTGSGAAGQNTLQRYYDDLNSKNIRIAGGSLDGSVDARRQAWLDAGGTAILDLPTIQNTNVSGPLAIMLDEPLMEDESCGGAGGAAARQGSRSGLVAAAHDHLALPTTATGLPARWSLAAAGPNPTGGAASWVLAVPMTSTVRAAIYDVRGRLVRRIAHGPAAAGYHDWQWDRSVEDGGVAAPGVYFLRVESREFRASQKVVLLPAGRW